MIARIVTGSGKSRQSFDIPVGIKAGKALEDRKGNPVMAPDMADVRDRLAMGEVVKNVLFGGTK